MLELRNKNNKGKFILSYFDTEMIEEEYSIFEDCYENYKSLLNFNYDPEMSYKLDENDFKYLLQDTEKYQKELLNKKLSEWEIDDFIDGTGSFIFPFDYSIKMIDEDLLEITHIDTQEWQEISIVEFNKDNTIIDFMKQFRKE